MRVQYFLFLFFIIFSSFGLAISQNDLDVISRMHNNNNIIIDDTSSLTTINNVIGDNEVYTPSTSLNEDIITPILVTSGTIYSEDAKIEVTDSNIDLNNVGIEKGIIAIAEDNITGNFSITFYTNMPNTPFSIKHYNGITDNKTLVQKEGWIIIPVIYSDENGTITYSSNNFSTQILSFPDPLVHRAGGETTTYYLDYFFSGYDFVTFKEDGVFQINNSFANSTYELYSPTDVFTDYSDSKLHTYIQYATKRVRLQSKNYTNGFIKSVTMLAGTGLGRTGEVYQAFEWDLNATSNIQNQLPVQIGYIPNQTIPMNSRQTFFFNDYFTNYTDIGIMVFNTSWLFNNDTSGSFDKLISINTTLYEYAGLWNNTIFGVDLNGLGNGISMAFYTNNSENITLEVMYIPYKKNSSGSYNTINKTFLFDILISGNASNGGSNITTGLGSGLMFYQSFDTNKTSTNVMIDSYNQYNGTKTTNTSIMPGKFNASLNFTTAGSKVIMGYIGDNTSTLTCNFWVNGFGNTPVWSALSKDDLGSNRIFGIDFDSSGADRIYLNMWNSTGSQVTPQLTGVNYLNKWVMVTMRKNMTHASIWLNASQTSSSALYGALKSGNANFTIGGRGDGSATAKGDIDEVSCWWRDLNGTEMTQLYNNGAGCNYACIQNLTSYSNGSYSLPQQSASLPNININTYEQVFLDYTDYFINFDRINISFTLSNGTNVSLYALLNSSSSKITETNKYILNLSGDSFSERLYIDAGGNESFTIFNVSICNHDACLYKTQTMNITTAIITGPPVQINHIDNIFMNLSSIHTENWGAYFTGYSSLSITFIDLITGNNVSILSYNTTSNFTTYYMNITSFPNAPNINTTFQSFNTSYYTVLLIDAINAYVDAGQYVNFNINYSYVPPPATLNETCITKGVICLFPDYTTQTQKQMNIYMIMSIIVTLVLLGVAIFSLLGEIGIVYTIISSIVIIFELIYFVKIQYFPITYVVWGTLALLGLLYLLYKRLSQ